MTVVDLINKVILLSIMINPLISTLRESLHLNLKIKVMKVTEQTKFIKIKQIRLFQIISNEMANR